MKKALLFGPFITVLLIFCSGTTAQGIPDLTGRWTIYTPDGQNAGINRIAQSGANITIYHPNGQVTSGGYIIDRNSLEIPAWGSKGRINANATRIDFLTGSQKGYYMIRIGGGDSGSGSGSGSGNVSSGQGSSLKLVHEFPRRDLDPNSPQTDQISGKLDIPVGPGILEYKLYVDVYHTGMTTAEHHLGINGGKYYLPDFFVRWAGGSKKPDPLIVGQPAEITARSEYRSFGKPITLWVGLTGMEDNSQRFQYRQKYTVIVTWTPIKN